uniref:N-acetyltransferase n=1 Tax=Panagrolaimus superbus TaxID=310955 RepID=A0A914YXD1_9BILA
MSSNESVVKQQSITNFLSSPFDITKMKPLMTSTPKIPPPTSRKRKAPTEVDKDANQMILDLGQKNIGMTNCQECGMIYNVDDIKDRGFHDNFHNRFSKTKFFKVENRSLESWKNKIYSEINVGKVSGTIFKVEKKPQISLKTKLEHVVKEIVDVQLHICEDVPVFDADKETIGFVFIVDATKSEPSYIGAIAMTEKVFAGKLMPIKKVYRATNEGSAFVAVERLWVHPTIRRKGVASHLLDVVRRIYSPSPLPLLQRSRIVFVDPNPVCVQFGKAFLDKSGRWMQYDGDEGDSTKSSSVQPGISTQMKNLNVEKKDEIPKKVMKIKNEKDEDKMPEIKPTKNVIKVEKEDVKASKVFIKIEDKENLGQKRIRTEAIATSKSNSETNSLKNLCRTIVIDETMNISTPINVPLMPPAV